MNDDPSCDLSEQDTKLDIVQAYNNVKNKRRGRPKLSNEVRMQRLAARNENKTSISIPKETRNAFNVYRKKLSEALGIELTITQTLKYLIDNANVPKNKQ